MMIALFLAPLACRGGVQGSVDFNVAAWVDDFRPRTYDGYDVPESRMDTPRTWIGSYFLLDGGGVMVDDSQGPGGATVGVGQPGVGVSTQAMLGPLIVPRWQPSLVGVQFVHADAEGTLSVSLTDPDGVEIWTGSDRVYRSKKTVTFPIPLEDVGDEVFDHLTWSVEPGLYAPSTIKLLLDAPEYGSQEHEAFLHSLAALGRCYNADLGLVAERCNGAPDVAYRPDVTALFALAVLVGNDLGFVDGEVSRDIVLAVNDALLKSVPVDPASGLMPERVTDDGELAEDSYWSTLHTAIALEALLLVAQISYLPTTEIEARLEEINWNLLTTNGAYPAASGVDADGQPLEAGDDFRPLGIFGSKALIVQLAHAGAEGELAPMDPDTDGFAPTWDGSGYDNELAALLFLTTDDDYDASGNDWHQWRDGAFWQNRDWMNDTTALDEFGLFGLSASEIPEPWTMPAQLQYGQWGIGGHNQHADDGFSTVGYTVIAPHYAIMTGAEHPFEVGPLIGTLLANDFLSPLNSVESIGVDTGTNLRWNHHQYAWTLAQQTLGLGRMLQTTDYLPYRFIEANVWLRNAHDLVLPGVAPE